ncbi:MAG: FtsW/RodA/SpoVE family cell cycle protein, partial [Acidocella sp.]
MILDNSLALRRPFRDRSFGVVRKLGRVNWLFVLCVCLLAGLGYTALYSAAGGSPEPYAQSQLYRFFGMLAMMLGIAMVDIRLIAKLSWPAYAVGILLLLVVMVAGHTGLGAKRWIDLGPIEIQPSELIKLFLSMALAYYFKRATPEQTGSLIFVLPMAVAVLVPVGL